jgi:hypothetical protein
MPRDSSKSGWREQELSEFRALQEEMLNLSKEYSQTRLAVWTEEAKGLEESWSSLSQEWQGSLEQMSTLATSKFEEIAATGETTSSLLAQNWRQSLTTMSGEVENWSDNLIQTLEKVTQAWGGTFAGTDSSSSGWTSLIGSVLDFGGWFHLGGIVEAHQGLVISPGALMADEQLVLAQTGEGILPRESMTRLGEKNFEALRTGQFGVTSGGGAPRYEINIQVQSLDAAGVAGLNWDRLVQRHLLPALQQEVDRRW